MTSQYVKSDNVPLLACEQCRTTICKSAGFTLIEVLLVVVILAVLAGTVLTRFLGATNDAKTSALVHSLHVMEAQIEVYRAQHLNQRPTIQNNGLPQLTASTNAAGEIGPASPSYPFGPYLMEDPVNPFDGRKNVAAVAQPGQKPSGAVGSLGGWQYDESNGAFWPNHTEYYK